MQLYCVVHCCFSWHGVLVSVKCNTGVMKDILDLMHQVYQSSYIPGLYRIKVI